MNPLPLSVEYENSLYAFNELMRRAVDGTVIPIFVDYGNNRVLIGATAVSTGTAGKIEVTGDVKVLGSSVGLILQEAGGSGRSYRLQIVEVAGEDGSNQPVIQLTRVD